MAERIRFGTTWWGKAWLNALSSIDCSNRLSRGRSYYSQGRIAEIVFHPKTLTVSAIVNGSAYYPYETSIKLQPMAPEDVERLVEEIAKRPPLVAKLLAGELDPEVADIARSLSIPLFPASWREFEMHCTCPDSAVPCKHLAAVYYAIIKTIDADPMWVFACRGVDLPALLKKRGIDLDEAVRITDPSWKTFASFSEEGRAAPEGIAWQSLPIYRIPNLVKVLAGLLPAQGGTRRELTRSKVEKLYRGMAEWASEKLSQREQGEDTWHAWEETLPHGAVMPALTLASGSPRLMTVRCRGLAEQPLSPGQHRTMIETLFATGKSEADAHSAGLSFWSHAAGAAASLLKRGAAVPVLVREEREPGVQSACVAWVPAVQSAETAEAVSAVAAAIEADPAAGSLPLKDGTPWGRALVVLGALLTEAAQAVQPLRAPAGLNRLWGVMSRPAQSLAYGTDDDRIAELRRFLKPLSLQQRSLRWQPVLTVRSSQGESVTLNFGVLPRQAASAAKPVLYRDVLAREAFAKERYAIISLFESLCEFYEPLRGILTSGGSPVRIATAELKDFLFGAVPSLQMLGMRVMLPRSLKRLLKPQITAKIGKIPGSKSVLSKEALADFHWEMKIGGRTLTLDDVRALQKSAGGIVRFEGDFVYLDPETLGRMKELLEKGREPSYLEKLRGALTGRMGDIEVSVAPDLLEQVKALSEVGGEPLPKGLRAVLRPYQVRGYAWLMKNIRLGIGALIADDMGLGKTVQVIAALLRLKESGEFEKARGLIVVPATLLTNWEREIARFAPQLSVQIYHGMSRSLSAPAQRADLIITTYGTLRRDIERLGGEPWRVMVIDEAQAVKNVGTGVAAAVRAVKVPEVIAMSGTPVENRLLEYWALLSIVQPGLLGSMEEFRRTFAQPIESDHSPEAIEAFRRITAPFMLRRVKTDRSVISELPEKLVSDRFVDLTPEQAALYSSTLERMMGGIDRAEAEGSRAKRSAAVLSLITALKQICNSPSQYRGTRTARPDSGKGEALMELTAECLAERRKVLVFTQYREMGERLQDWYETAMGHRPDFLHGGVPVAKRAEMVDAFQNDPGDRVLIVSLKAGGTGLNLTAASAVVHYDLWWNPAVENQATDRAYRIGQNRDVLVFRFLCAGTFEERINEMLGAKRELAELTVVTGESWVGDLSTSELRRMFSLQPPKDR